MDNDEVLRLLDRVRQADEAAFRELYRGFSRRLYAYVLRQVGDPAQSEEIVADRRSREVGARLDPGGDDVVPHGRVRDVRSGIVLVKYWFSVSDAEQERRFQARINDPTKRWKLSPMDLQSRSRWLDYSKAKDEMFAHCDIKQAPWYVVTADNKKRARLNVINHLLGLIPYQDLTPEEIELPPRQADTGYVRPPMTDQTFVPEVY